MNFIEISWNFMKFWYFRGISRLLRFLGCRAPQTLLFPKENKGFVEGCGWLKTQNFMDFHIFHEISESFMRFHEIALFSVFSRLFGPAALQRKNDSNSYAFSMVAALQFLTGHSQNWFSMKIMDSNQNNWEFHEIP